MNARRGWVRAQERGRVAVARELAKLELKATIVCGMCQGMGVDFDVECDCPSARGTVYHREDCEDVWCTLCEGTGSGRRVLALALALLSDPAQGFDVHRAREHAERLILLGGAEPSAERLAVVSDWREAHPDKRLELAPMSMVRQHADFVAWTRARGDGPEADIAWRVGRDCDDECSVGWHSIDCFGSDDGRGGWPGKLARQWGGDSRAPMGRAYARLGRRILDALKGQPDACRSEWCVGLTGNLNLTCPDCRGSGHNLRGVLAPIEWSPQVRRMAIDGGRALALRDDRGAGRPQWRSLLSAAVDPLEWSRNEDRHTVVTRVVPRGDHRTPGVEVIERNGRRVELRDQARGWIPKDSKSGGHDRRRPGPECWPRWKHGEHRHAGQRSARAYDREQRTITVTGTITV